MPKTKCSKIVFWVDDNPEGNRALIKKIENTG